MSRTFPAIRYVQNKRPMYSLAVPAGYLTNHVVVDVYDPNLSLVGGQAKGYQRMPDYDRAKKIGKYLSNKDAVLPASVLLNVRTKGDVSWAPVNTEGDDSSQIGELQIPDGLTVYMVDGQHRQEGFRSAMTRHSHLKNYMVPAVLMEGFKEEEEALQFYLLNTKAKKVPTDLSRRLLIERGLIRYLEQPKPWEIKAVQITIALNNHIANPWLGKIRPPNVLKQHHHIVTEKSFVPSLQYTLANKLMQKYSAKKLTTFLSEYWRAMQSIFGPAFAKPRSYIIQKTPGIYSHHMLAPIVFNNLLKNGKKITATEIENRFVSWRKLPTDFWASSNDTGAKRFGGGITGFQNLAIYLASEAKLQ